MGRIEIVRRSVLAEVLRRAFIGIGASGQSGADSVHGQFGQAGDWDASRKSSVAAWLRDHAQERALVVDQFLTGADTELQERRDELLAFVTSGFLSEVDSAARHNEQTALALSQRLADAGLLPMFGFPTRMRTLYTRRPTIARPWPPRATIARDASVALSTWSPGSEVIKDKGLHRVVGFADFRPQGARHVASVPDPLGPRRDVGQCTECGTVDTTAGDKDACPACAAPVAVGGQAGYRRLTIVQPIGYRTDFKRREYKGWLEWSASGSRPRMSAEPVPLMPVEYAQIGAASSMQIFQINDNNGRDWELAPAKTGDGWICTEVVDKHGNEAEYDDAGKQSVALAATKRTDVLVIGVQPDSVPAGFSLRPDKPQRRAAWYSLGFLLRGAAARYLDVQIDELDVGLRAVSIAGEYQAQLFLSDVLANGAGYCTHLGHAAQFTELLDHADTWGTKLSAHGEAGALCDSACYDCLRDYRNMPYHGLLDWRLALDMLDLLRGRNLAPTRWDPVRDIALARFCDGLEDYELDAAPGGLPAARDGDDWIIPLHPLMDADESHLAEHAAEAKVELEAEGSTVFLTDYFNLLRRPSWVYTHALALD